MSPMSCSTVSYLPHAPPSELLLTWGIFHTRRLLCLKSGLDNATVKCRGAQLFPSHKSQEPTELFPSVRPNQSTQQKLNPAQYASTSARQRSAFHSLQYNLYRIPPWPTIFAGMILLTAAMRRPWSVSSALSNVSPSPSPPQDAI